MNVYADMYMDKESKDPNVSSIGVQARDGCLNVAWTPPRGDGGTLGPASFLTQPVSCHGPSRRHVRNARRLLR